MLDCYKVITHNRSMLRQKRAGHEASTPSGGWGFLLSGEKKMQKVIVTLSGLAETRDGVPVETSAAFKVWQGGNLLIDDTLYGKSTAAYRHGYDVECSDAPLRVEHNSPDLEGLSVTACVA